MKIVVDSNIIFSALLSPDGGLSELLLHSGDTFSFFTSDFAIVELKNHFLKLIKVSGRSRIEIEVLQRILFNKIEIVNLDLIHENNFIQAAELTQDIDEFDIPFVALSLELKSMLWTGDKKLIKGLTSKGIDWIVDTDGIRKLRNQIRSF